MLRSRVRIVSLAPTIRSPLRAGGAVVPAGLITREIVGSNPTPQPVIEPGDAATSRRAALWFKNSR